MFSGIIKSIVTIRDFKIENDLARLVVDCTEHDKAKVKLGDSIAFNGICLTVVEIAKDALHFDLSHETLATTSAGRWQSGQQLNMEPALCLGDSLDGHLVSGHVDDVGSVEQVEAGASVNCWIRHNANLSRFIAVKGSITVDGVSLTVNEVKPDAFSVTIVPHTWQQTIFQHYQPGTKVNLEVDLIARYLERLAMGVTSS